ncbi:hypothetical protein ACIQZG_18970 [Lysinibacillus sp. NPDC096418]
MDLITATMSDTFSNGRFIVILVLMNILIWTIGLGLRKYKMIMAERSK